MEENHPEWRKGNNTLSKAVSRRKGLIAAIEKRIYSRDTATDEEAVEVLEQKRKELNFSLDKFQKELKKQKLI
jgi:hypothetical protein